MTRDDLYASVTASIVEAIEAGTRPWAPRWDRGAGAGFGALPLRSTGEAYRGVNVLLLWGTAMAKGYQQPRWMTFKQALELGAAVRKGEKGARVVKAGRLTRDAGEGQTGDENGQVHIPFLKGYTVFNVEQIDGLGADWFEAAAPALPEPERDAAAEAFFAATGARVQHGGAVACYVPSTDQIHMPPLAAFTDLEAYYATLAHEFVHWTGHGSRLDRAGGKRFADRGYAFEELVAEIGAAFVCASLGLSAEPRADHASYVGSWLKALKNEPRAIFTAASAAQAAADYLHAQAQPLAAAA